MVLYRSGKSTIGQLLNRFYDPDCGRITIDGIDIRTVNVSSLRKHIGIIFAIRRADVSICTGVVFQQPTLFSGTIRTNLLYGKSGSEVSDQDIEAACKVAYCHDFISGNLPEKYETDVGGSGNERLSGGQKQVNVTWIWVLILANSLSPFHRGFVLPELSCPIHRSYSLTKPHLRSTRTVKSLFSRCILLCLKICTHSSIRH